MIQKVRWFRFPVLLILTVLTSGIIAAAAPDAGPPASDASAIMQKVVERAKALADSSVSCSYRKISVVEQLNAKGEVKQSGEREYDVLLIGGYPFNRLVRVKGETLDQKALEQENKREREAQSRMTLGDPKKLGQRKQGWLTKDLIDRFSFVVRERTIVNGRPTLLMDFAPNPIAPAKTLQDRFLAGFAGTLAVDEQDYAVTSLSTRLQNPVPIGWFGVLGTLEGCELTLERTRVADGLWVNLNQNIRIAGRKLVTPMSLRITEKSSEFRCASIPSDGRAP